MEVAVGAQFSQQFHWSKAWRGQIAWRGVPALKCPLDLWSYHQILYDTRPDVVIECGVAAGGTTLFLADLLERAGSGVVVGIDTTLQGVAAAVVQHPRIQLLEGSSLSDAVVSSIRATTKGRRAMVILDSDHSVSHVLAELRVYADLVAPGCYLICEDGNLDRPEAAVCPGYAGPHAALTQFLRERPDFRADESRILGATFNPLGYLLRSTAQS